MNKNKIQIYDLGQNKTIGPTYEPGFKYYVGLKVRCSDGVTRTVKQITGTTVFVGGK
jgi:hypothetical protein